MNYFNTHDALAMASHLMRLAQTHYSAMGYDDKLIIHYAGYAHSIFKSSNSENRFMWSFERGWQLLPAKSDAGFRKNWTKLSKAEGWTNSVM